MAILILIGSRSVWICRMIWILSVVNNINKAVSTLVMVVYEQDYRGTTLSIEAGTKLEIFPWRSFDCDIE